MRLERQHLRAGLQPDPTVLFVRQDGCALQGVSQRFTIRVDDLVRIGGDNPAIFRETAVNELRCEANIADLGANVISADRQVDRALGAEASLQLEHTLARHDDLLLRLHRRLEADLAHRQPMAVRRDGPQELALRFQQHAVQVIADVLLRHREMRLVDQTTEIRLRYRDRLLGVDLIDHREFRGRQTREREAALAAFHGHAIRFRADGHLRAFGQRAKNIQQFTARDGDVSGLDHLRVACGDEFNLEVRPRDAEAIVARHEQHIGQHRHGLAALNDADNALQGGENLFARRGQLHVFCLNVFLI